MRIVFVSLLNTKDVHAWSGTPFFMVQALRAWGHEVVEIGALNVTLAFGIRLVRKAHSAHHLSSSNTLKVALISGNSMRKRRWFCVSIMPAC
jgi:hypothetical protein